MDNLTAEQALDAVRNVLQRAYNSAEPVCCGRARTACCGSPEPEWSEYDQQIMNDLQPVEEYLRQAMLAASHDPVAQTIERDSGTLTVEADGGVSKIEPKRYEETESGHMPIFRITKDDEIDMLRAEVEALRGALVEIRSSLNEANEAGHIKDTLWMPFDFCNNETLFDFLDRAIDAARLREGGDA